jgi:hypothetical protein
LAVLALLAASACNDSSGYHEPGPRPRIVKVDAPTTVNCAPEDTGGACPIQLGVFFRLPEDQVVTKAYVRFQRDGSDYGVDRGYILPPTFGLGETADASVGIDAAVPPNLLDSGALFTYSVRLVTGLGEESPESTLTITVTNNPIKKDEPSTEG